MKTLNDSSAAETGGTKLGTRLVSTVGIVTLLLSFGGDGVAHETRMPVVRMAELEIEPAKLDAFKAAVKEEMETSVRVEQGVLAIYAVAEKENPTKLRFFEMYADEAAFKSHIESPHFQKFHATTKDMVVSRKLIETVPVQLSEKKR